MPDPTHPVLSVRGLGMRLGERWLWREIDLDLGPGEAMTVTGPSGTGKSLLLRSLIGLEPVAEGKLAFEGRSIGAWRPDALRARIVFLHQEPVFREGTVRADLQAILELGIHRGRSLDEDLLGRWLHRLGRERDLLDRRTTDLSGGEKQIVALLRALQVRPRVLLLDEPTGSLDRKTEARVEQLLADWRRKGGALLWTTHDPEQAGRVAERRLAIGER